LHFFIPNFLCAARVLLILSGISIMNFPVPSDKKEWLVLVFAAVIWTLFFSILEYGYHYDFTGVNLLIKITALIFLFWPICFWLYKKFNISRFLK